MKVVQSFFCICSCYCCSSHCCNCCYDKRCCVAGSFWNFRLNQLKNPFGIEKINDCEVLIC